MEHESSSLSSPTAAAAASTTVEFPQHGVEHGLGLARVIIPIVCFSSIVIFNIKYLHVSHPPSYWVDHHRRAFTRGDFNNARTFFDAIRTRWIIENYARGMVPVQTIRDYLSITTALATAALTFVQIFLALSKSGIILSCSVNTKACTSADRFTYTKLVLVFANYIIVFINFLLATRYAVNTSFMMNTKRIDGFPMNSVLIANIFARASFHYSLGMRGFFFAVPLVAWIFGSIPLAGMTLVYLCGSYFIEEDMLAKEELLPGWEEPDPPSSSQGRASTAEVVQVHVD